MKAIDILTEEPFPGLTDIGFEIPPDVRAKINADDEAARKKADAEKKARRGRREKDQFRKLRKQAKPISTAVRTLFGDDFKSEMSKPEVNAWLKKNRNHFKQYVKPFKNMRRFNGLVRLLAITGVGIMQIEEIWVDYNAIKELYHMNPPQMTKETHDYFMNYLDVKMVKVAIPLIATAIVAAIIRAARLGMRPITVMLTAISGINLAYGNWIPAVIEALVLLGVEWLLTSTVWQKMAEEYFRGIIAEYLLGYSPEDIARIERDLVDQVREEEEQAAAAKVGKTPQGTSDEQEFLNLLRKADPSLRSNTQPAAGGGTIY